MFEWLPASTKFITVNLSTAFIFIGNSHPPPLTPPLLRFLYFLHRTIKKFIHCATLKKSFSRVRDKVLWNHSLLAEYLKSFLVPFFKLIFFPHFYMSALLIFSLSLCQWLTYMLRTSWCSSSLTWTNPFPSILHLHLGYSAFSFRWLLFFTFHVVKYDAVPVCYTWKGLQWSP